MTRSSFYTLLVKNGARESAASPSLVSSVTVVAWSLQICLAWLAIALINQTINANIIMKLTKIFSTKKGSKSSPTPKQAGTHLSPQELLAAMEQSASSFSHEATMSSSNNSTVDHCRRSYNGSDSLRSLDLSHSETSAAFGRELAPKKP